MFQQIIKSINSVINTSQAQINQTKFIGILDIYGFEIFTRNSFEQFCINYANEKLQQHFIKHVFKSQEALYIEEDIPFEKVKYIDNSDVLEFIEQRPLGIISSLDDELKLPNPTD